MTNMFKIAIRSARLDKTVFQEIGQNPTSVLYGAGIVILVGIALSFTLTGGPITNINSPPKFDEIGDRLLSMWLTIMTLLVGWMLWSSIAYVLAGKFLQGNGGFRSTVRSIGISYSPGFLLILTPIPTIGDPVSIIALLWILITSVVAIHEIHNLDWLGSIMSTVTGWILALILLPTIVIGAQPVSSPAI